MERYRHEFIVPTETLDIRLEYTVDPGGTVISKHFHEWLEIVYLTKGDLEVQINNDNHILQVGDFIVINPMCIHSTRCRNGNEAILFQIPVSFLEKFTPDIRDYQFFIDMKPENPRTETKLENISDVLKNLWIAYQFQVDGYMFRCYSLIFELMYILVHSFSRKLDSREKRRNDKNMERLKKIQDYVEEHYMYPLSIGQIADELGLNGIYFSRFFKKNMGITFMQYLNEVRMEKIYRDILNTNLSIKSIQERHGFYNDKVFRRLFRELYGCSPGEIRKKVKKENE